MGLPFARDEIAVRHLKNRPSSSRVIIVYLFIVLKHPRSFVVDSSQATGRYKGKPLVLIFFYSFHVHSQLPGLLRRQELGDEQDEMTFYR